MKVYTFTLQELIVLREALTEYRHYIRPGPDASDSRVRTFIIACSLQEQFKEAVRLA
jgi:hypothetical protein